MKAIVRSQYGSPDVLRLQDIDRPEPGDDEIMVRVHAASVNPYDWHMMTGLPYLARLSAGLRRPRNPVLGADVAGRVEAVGRDVTWCRAGDEVFGQAEGGYAEYACLRGDRAACKPPSLTYEQAAALPIAGVTALQALRDSGRIRTGQRVLVNGAGGGVGTFAVQIAVSYGTTVTGVCGTGNVELVRSLGADDVLDYTKDDIPRAGDYDLILDLVGNRPLRDWRRALRPTGSYVAVGAPKHGQWIGPLVFVAKVLLMSLAGRRMVPMLATLTRDDLNVLATLVSAGKVTPVIDRAFPLAAVAAALEHIGTGHAPGKVVISE